MESKKTTNNVNNSLLSNAFSMFFEEKPATVSSSTQQHPQQGKGGTGGGGGGDGNIDDIPREELLHLLMKMNKRMQGLETKHNELIKKTKSIQQDRELLLEMIKSSLPEPVIIKENETELDAAKDAWLHFVNGQKTLIRSLEESNLKLKRELQNVQANSPGKVIIEKAISHDILEEDQMSSDALIGKLKKDIELLQLENDELSRVMTHSKEISDRLRGDNDVLRSKLALCEQSLNEKANKISELQLLMEEQKAKAEEDILYAQMQIKTVKSKDENREKLRKELDTANSQISSLQQEVATLNEQLDTSQAIEIEFQEKIESLQQELEKTKAKLRDVDKNSSASAVLKAQQEAQVSALRKDLTTAVHANEETLRKLRELEEYKQKADAQLERQAEDKARLTKAEDALDEANSLIARLRGQVQSAETNFALRTAMLATAEAQVQSLRDALQAQEDAVKESVERVTSLQLKLSEAEFRLEERVKEAAAKIKELELQIEDTVTKCNQDIATKEQEFTVRMNDLIEESNRKSNLARITVAEKEEEIRILLQKNNALKEEIASGAPSERKIFELAQSQAKREAAIYENKDTQDLALQQLQSALASKDLEVATLQQKYSELLNETNQLRRSTKREGVNMDYLKNIILQFMSFPPTSSERNALIPVIAMLLQFSKQESLQVEAAIKSPIWTLPVKDIKLHPTSTIVKKIGEKNHSQNNNGNGTSASASNNHQVHRKLSSDDEMMIKNAIQGIPFDDRPSSGNRVVSAHEVKLSDTESEDDRKLMYQPPLQHNEI